MVDEPRVDADEMNDDSDELPLAPPERLNSEKADVPSESASDITLFKNPLQKDKVSQPSEEGSQPSPADFESKFEQRIRETEEKLASQFNSLIERVNKSNRDATRARFDELKARVDEFYHVQAAALDELVAGGKLNAADAAVQKLKWRDQYERQALAEAKRLTILQKTATALSPAKPEAMIDPAIARGISERLDWATRKRDMLEALDLTGAEPEYARVMARWDPQRAQDAEGAASQFRALAKQVRQQVDARILQGRRGTDAALETAQPLIKRPPMIESGGGGPAHSFDAQKELEQLIEKGPPNDPRKATRYLKRLEELEAALE